MRSEHEWLQQQLVTVLGQLFAGMDERIVFAVPQGVVILTKDGRHILIRIDDATLEVVR